MTQTPPEQSGSSLVPAILAILAGLSSYAATQKAVEGWIEVGEALGVSKKISGALVSVAQKAFKALLDRTTSPRARAELNAVLQEAVDKAVADGIQMVSQAARSIVEDVVEFNANKKAAPESFSPRGEKYFPVTEDIDYLTTPVDPDRMRKTAEDLARRTHQTVNDALGYYAATEAGWPRKTWHSKNDTRTRPSHAFLGSPKYEFHTVDIGKPFITIEGHEIRYPHDPLAPISETANCRCWLSCHRGKAN